MDYIQIPLTGLGLGKFAKVSPEDYALCVGHKWYYRNGYALAVINKKEVRMHRYVMMETDPNYVIDHRNRDRLDNRRSNLRRFTLKQNANNTSTNRKIFAFGEWKTVAEWADDCRCSVSYSVLLGRLKKEIEPELAIIGGDLHD